jgi:sugar phosphate isomerase/epimerase
MPRISYQLYCSRNHLPLADTLQMLAKTGYSEVEGYGALLDDVDTLKAGLDASGLKMRSGHVALDQIESDPVGVIATVRSLGFEKVFAPYLQAEERPTSSDAWAAFGKRLAEAGKPLQDAGLVFGWHNHDFECPLTPQGDTPLDLIVAGGDDIMLELDLGWVRRAGFDPVTWIEKYAGRITTAHIKDIAAEGTCVDEDGWADVGQGTMDWTSIHSALQAAGVDHYVVEHDNPSDDQRFAARSLASVQKF